MNSYPINVEIDYKNKQEVKMALDNRINWFEAMTKIGKVTMSEEKIFQAILANQLAILTGLSYLINKGEQV